MGHVRQTIRESVVAQLVGTSPSFRTLAADRVYETRILPLERQQLPAIAVYAEKETVDPRSKDNAGELQRDLSLVIDGIVEAGLNVDDAIDDLAKQIECAMNIDMTFGVAEVGNSILSSTETDIGVSGAKPIGMVRLTYAVTYYTPVPDVDCAPALSDFTQADVKWDLENTQAPADQAEDTFNPEG